MFSPPRFGKMPVLSMQSTRVAFASLQCCCRSLSNCSGLAGTGQGQSCSAPGAGGEILSRNMPLCPVCSSDTILQACLDLIEKSAP